MMTSSPNPPADLVAVLSIDDLASTIWKQAMNNAIKSDIDWRYSPEEQLPALGTALSGINRQHRQLYTVPRFYDLCNRKYRLSEKQSYKVLYSPPQYDATQSENGAFLFKCPGSAKQPNSIGRPHTFEMTSCHRLLNMSDIVKDFKIPRDIVQDMFKSGHFHRVHKSVNHCSNNLFCRGRKFWLPRMAVTVALTIFDSNIPIAMTHAELKQAIKKFRLRQCDEKGAEWQFDVIYCSAYPTTYCICGKMLSKYQRSCKHINSNANAIANDSDDCMCGHDG